MTIIAHFCDSDDPTCMSVTQDKDTSNWHSKLVAEYLMVGVWFEENLPKGKKHAYACPDKLILTPITAPM